MVGLPREELPKLRDVFREGWYFIFVIVLLVVLLLVMKRENWAPWLATALLLVLNQLFSKQRWGLQGGRRSFIEGNGRVFVELVGHPRRRRPAGRRVLADRAHRHAHHRTAASSPAIRRCC